MKSKLPSKKSKSLAVRPHTNKVLKNHKNVKKLNGSLNIPLTNSEYASLDTLTRQADRNSPTSGSSSLKKKKNKHEKSEDGNHARLKLSPNSIVPDADSSFIVPSMPPKKKKGRRKLQVNASLDNGNAAVELYTSNCDNPHNNLSSIGSSTAKKKNKNRRKSEALDSEEKVRTVNNSNDSFTDTSPPMKIKKKHRKSDTSLPKDGNPAIQFSSKSGTVNGLGSETATTTTNDSDSPKQGKKKRRKKKRKSGPNMNFEALNTAVDALGKETSQSGSEGNAKKLKQMWKQKEQLEELPRITQGSHTDEKESKVPLDQNSISKGKQKREKFKNSKNSSLRERMLSRLSAARFRYINEELYTWDGQESPKVFASDPKSFKAYHSGFKHQTKLWPINPIEVIIKSIKKVRDFEKKVIADFGCGEAKLALELSSNKVYSFDLVALNDRVTVCDNANTKLYSGSVDIAVHCLSLMSSNISGYIKEANRVLKTGGILKIAEVESRFEDAEKFVENVCKFNFKLLKKDLTHNLFYFMDFEKLADIGVARKRKLPVLSLQPCLYKKRRHIFHEEITTVNVAQPLPLCPLVPPNLIGTLGAYKEGGLLSDLENQIGKGLLPGGQWRPSHCKARDRVAIIIPYRDRTEHLSKFLANMHPFLQRQLLDYGIFVIEQFGNDVFNRAMLLNVGFVEAQAIREFDCFIFHDVDLLPEDDRNLYTCPDQPRHMSAAVDVFNYRLPYADIFGGVSAMSKAQFQKVNGFSNKYWGWGGEDDDMAARIKSSGLHITRYPPSVARYTMLSHTKQKANPKRYETLYKGRRRMKKDGLNSIKYRKVASRLTSLFTWFLVELEKV